MKKLFSLLLVLGLGIVLVAGCSSTSTTSQTTIPAETIAGSVGVAAFNSLTVDNAAGLAAGIGGFSVSAAEVVANAVTWTRSADGWFEGSDSYTSGGFTFTRTFAIKVYASNGVEVTEVAALAGLSNISKMVMATTIQYIFSGGSYTIDYGTSKADPLTFTYLPSKSIDGPIEYTSTYSGSSFSITFDYGNLTLSAGGYPSGTVNWAVYQNGSETAGGTITFNGTKTAIFTFTSGATGTYNIDLSNGSAY